MKDEEDRGFCPILAQRQWTPETLDRIFKLSGQNALGQRINACSLGVGCDQAGYCFAVASGKPEACGKL